MTKCYFCLTELAPIGSPYYNCHFCAEKYDLEYVSTASVSEGPNYIHMKIRGLDIGVRLNVKEGNTHLLSFEDHTSLWYDNIIATLPGFPLRPDNIHKKLKMYILFS